MTTTTNDLRITTTEHPNATSLREGFAAFGRGDLDAVRARMSEDCTWTIPGNSVLTGTYRGWDAIVGMFGKLLEITGGTMTMQVLSCFADDARAVAIYDSTSTVGGQTATMRFFLAEELGPDGLVTEATVIPYDQAASDAHLAGVPQQR